MTGAELRAEGWHSFDAREWPDPEAVVEFARDERVHQQSPWVGRWCDLAPEFNVTGLWWRSPTREDALMTDELSEREFHIAITMKAKEGRVTYEWGGYALLSELATAVLEKCDEFGWLDDLVTVIPKQRK